MGDHDIGLRGLARQSYVTGPRAPLQPEQLIALLQAVAEVRDDPDQMAWLKSEYSAVYDFIDQVPHDVLLKGRTDPTALQASAQKIADQIAQHLARSRWDDFGLSPIYENTAKKLCSKPDWKFIQDLPVGNGEKAPRFIMPEDAYRPLIPGQSRLDQKAFDWNMVNDLVEHLTDLGVQAPDVREQELGSFLHRLTHDYIHIPPVDAALLMDCKEIGVRGKRLGEGPDKWNFARRLDLDGESRNWAVIPIEYALDMRGVAYGLPDHQPETIRKRCAERLAQRLLGVESAEIQVVDGHERVVSPDADGEIAMDLDVRLADVDGKQCVVMKPDDGRVLLSPIALGDPAAKFSTKRPTFDPDAQGYDGENGVFLVQAAKLAYQDEETIKLYTEAWGLTGAKLMTHEETDAEAFSAYDPEQNTIVIGFRGTEPGSEEDVRIDADIGLDDSEDFPLGGVHGGFLRQFQALKPQLLTQIETLNRQAAALGKPPPKIMIGGHSLGGALAAMFTYWGLANGLPVTQTYTCGQPAFAGKNTARHFAELRRETGCNYFRYVNNNDIVPRVPPNCTHEGVELYINSDGKLEPPGVFQRWNRVRDRLNGIVENWSLSSGVDVIDSVSDHYCDFYLGLIRKNRAVQIAAEVVAPVVEAAAEMVRDARDVLGARRKII